jgi:hypothetical protein
MATTRARIWRVDGVDAVYMLSKKSDRWGVPDSNHPRSVAACTVVHWAFILAASFYWCVANATDVPAKGFLQVNVLAPFSNSNGVSGAYPSGKAGIHEIGIAACRGEYEPASLLVRAGGEDIEDIQIEASDLLDAQSQHIISKNAVDIRLVKQWFQGSSAWRDIRKINPQDFRQVMVSELLLKDDALVSVDVKGRKNFVKALVDNGVQYVHVNQNRHSQLPFKANAKDVLVVDDANSVQPFSLDAGLAKQVWVTVTVPSDALPGYYSGRLTLSSRGKLLQDVWVRLRVLPFDLLRSNITHSIYYRAQLVPDSRGHSGGSEYRTVRQMSGDLQDMLAHGVSNPTMYQSSFDIAAVEKALQLRRSINASEDEVPLYYVGMQTTETYLGSTASSAQKALAYVLPMVGRLAKKSGFYPTYIYGRDEAVGVDLAAQRPWWSRVHQVDSRVFVAGSTGAYPLVGDLLDLFVHYGKPNVAEAEKWHFRKKLIFSYANPQSGPENPYLFRLNYGVMLWAHNYDGAMPYAYQHCFGSCWNDVDHTVYRDHMFTYPTANGVVSTLAWEAFREAVDDTRYIATLERMLDDGRNSATEHKAKARAYLDELRRYLRDVQAESGLYNHDAPVDLDSVRASLQRHIVAIVEQK